jgi:hypothetical protein
MPQVHEWPHAGPVDGAREWRDLRTVFVPIAAVERYGLRPANSADGAVRHPRLSWSMAQHPHVTWFPDVDAPIDAGRSRGAIGLAVIADRKMCLNAPLWRRSFQLGNDEYGACSIQHGSGVVRTPPPSRLLKKSILRNASNSHGKMTLQNGFRRAFPHSEGCFDGKNRNAILPAGLFQQPARAPRPPEEAARSEASSGNDCSSNCMALGGLPVASGCIVVHVGF